MCKIKRVVILTVFLFLFGFVGVAEVYGGISEDGMDGVLDQDMAFNKGAKFAPADCTNIYTTIATVIKTFLGFLGIIFVILIIYAGFNYMTAAGEEEKVRTAMSTIKRAIIGLIIIVSSMGITNLVISKLVTGAGGGSVAC